MRPSNVIVFTFTDKAAVELKDRIQRVVLETLGNVVGLAEMYVGTMHGYCLDLSDVHPEMLSTAYSPNHAAAPHRPQ